MRTFLIGVFSAAAILPGLGAAEDSHGHGHAHWGYRGATAPQHWADMQPDFAACKLGKEQSPIDIRDAKKADLKPLGFAYTASPAEVVNNGHTIQVNLAGGGTLALPSGEFRLVQFHFHTPSEEKVGGKAYPMVAHLVHKDDGGRLAVVAVLFKLGKTNPAVAKVFAAMPKQAEGKAELAGGFDANELLPADRGYYAFMGSLTTPPCSEGVRWQVLKQPVELSKAQLAAFRKLYPMNARPVQPLNQRLVEQSQ